MKKKDVNYKVITGMHAVGNQCRDCKGSTPADDVPNPNYMKCRKRGVLTIMKTMNPMKKY